jgi:hypothetical protein
MCAQPGDSCSAPGGLISKHRTIAELISKNCLPGMNSKKLGVFGVLQDRTTCDLFCIHFAISIKETICLLETRGRDHIVVRYVEVRHTGVTQTSNVAQHQNWWHTVDVQEHGVSHDTRRGVCMRADSAASSKCACQ